MILKSVNIFLRILYNVSRKKGNTSRYELNYFTGTRGKESLTVKTF